MNTSSPRRAAFTLVELLVVIAIIALLVSILLPSLAKAREQAKATKCLTNLKDMVAAGMAYSQEDPKEWVVPLHPRFNEPGTSGSGKYVSAARHAFGGKSGRHDWIEEITGFGGGSVTGRYSTQNRMGPASRPLNRFIYRDIVDRTGLDLEEMQKDEKLDFSVFRCPSDNGFTEGGSKGVYLGFGTYYKEATAYYDNLGSSYATDSLIYTGGGGGAGVTGIGAFIRPYTQFGDASRLTVFKETNGFYAGGWRTIGEEQETEQEYAVGNHGVTRQHQVGFGDGHASSVLFEVRTDVSLTADGVIHTGIFTLRGATIENVELNPPELFADPDNLSLGGIGRFLYSGPGWKDHAFPAPAIKMYDNPL